VYMSMVPVRPVAIAAQLAQFILSGGYLETPSEYLDETEIQDYLDELATNTASIEDDASERAINDVLCAYDLEKQLGMVANVDGSDWGTLMGNLSLTCAQHPAACVVSVGNKAMCIAGVDGSLVGNESRYFFVLLDIAQQPTPRICTVDNEYDIQMPHIPVGVNYTAVIVQSKCFQTPPPPPSQSDKGKEEEEEAPKRVRKVLTDDADGPSTKKKRTSRKKKTTTPP